MDSGKGKRTKRTRRLRDNYPAGWNEQLVAESKNAPKRKSSRVEKKELVAETQSARQQAWILEEKDNQEHSSAKPSTRGDQECCAEEQSYERVLQSFQKCTNEFIHVPGSRFHASRLMADLYHGQEYHSRFYVYEKDGSTMFEMGQILTVVLNVETLEEALSRAGKTLNEEISRYLDIDCMTALPRPDLIEYPTEGWDGYRGYETYVRVDTVNPMVVQKDDLREIVI